MIEVKVNSGNVEIERVRGTAINIMADLCCAVKGVCMSFCEDEKDGKEMAKEMILLIADALAHHENLFQEEKLEDDENVDF